MLQTAYKMIRAVKNLIAGFRYFYWTMFIVGSLFAMTSLSANAQNRSFDFTAGDNVTLTNAASALSNRSTFTLEFWAKFTSVSGTINLVDFTGGVDAGGLVLNGGKLAVDLAEDFGNATVSNALSLSAGTWYHIAVVFDNGTWSFYVDGVAQGTNVPDQGGLTSVPNYSAFSVTNLVFGFQNHNSVDDFVGSIDDIRLWTSARTSTQIQNNRSNELLGNESGLLGYWKLNETSGTTVNDSQTNTSLLTGTSSGIAYNATGAFLVDVIAPTVISVTSSTSDGTYKVGDPISIQVNFSEDVIVASGTPQLTLETGTTDRTINYTGGTNSSTLTFTYTVQAGDTTADLDYTTINALALNGSTIRDAAGNNTILTLATPGAANSLGNNKALVIDGVVPTVTSVNSVTANGTYKIGDVISVQINFSETVTVTGTPQLTLETGATDRTISYASGSGTSTLTFSYTVQAGDNSNDLDYVATTSLALGGGTIRDAAGNSATLTLATPGLVGSLGANKNLVIDGVVPSVTSTTPVGGALSTNTSVDFTVTFSEAVSGVSTDDFALGVTGSVSGTIASVSGLSGTTVDVTVSGINGNGTIKLNVNGSTNIVDAAGNSGLAAYTSGTTHTVAIPLLTITIGTDKTALKAGETATLTFTLSESSTNFILGDITATGGVVSNLSGSGTSYTATFTPTDNSTTGATVDVAGGVFTNAVGNGNTAATQLTMTVDTIVPTVSINTDKPALKAGETATLTFTLSESSTNFILGDITATGGVVSNLSGSGTSYTATFTPTANSTTGATVDVAGGVFTDAAGNGNTAATQVTMTVDTIVPTVTIGSNKTALKAGETATLTFTLSESSTDFVLGDITATGGVVSNLSGSGTSYTATFTPAANATIGATVDVAGGVFTDAAGNGNTAAIQLTMTVDTELPAITGVAFDQANVTAANQSAISLSLAGAEVGAKASYSITSSNGGTAVTATDLAVGSVTQQYTGINVSGLSDGVLTVTLTLVDLAGNVSTAVTSTTNKDANIPEVTSVVITSGNYAEGDVISVSITLSKDVTVSGANSTMAINIGGVTREATFVSENAGVLLYQYTVQATDNTDNVGVIALGNGLSLNGDTVRDASSNDASLVYAQSSNTNAQVDTLAPAVAVIAVPAAPVSVNADDYTISGTHSENGVTVKLYLDANNDGIPDNALVLDSAVVANGAWSLIALLTGDSVNNFVVIAEDAAGNTSAPADIPTITEDSIAPDAPSVPVLSAESDTGTSDTDGVTSNTTPVFSGTAEPNSTITLTSDKDGVVATVVVDSSGDWSIPTNTLTGGVHNITATATDAAGNVSTLSTAVSLTIDSQAPTLTAVANQSLNPGTSSSALAITLGDDASLPANLTLTATSSNLAVVPAANLVLGGTGASRTITVTALGSGTAIITLSVEDEAGNTANTTFTVTVNSAPVIGGVPATSVNQGVVYSFAPTSSDANGDVLTFSITSMPSWASFNNATGALTGTPTNTDVGTTSGIVISVSDGTLTTSLSAFNLTVVNVNDAPVISGTPATSVDQDVAYSFTPTASDVDEGDTLTFSAAGLPNWLTINPATGAITGTPGNADVGVTDSIVITVTDAAGAASDLPAFSITVVNVNDAPTITSSPVTTATQDEVYSYTLVAVDEDDGDTTTLSAETLPDWLSFDPVTGVLSGTPTNDHVGSHAVSLNVVDTGGLSIDQSFTILVTDVNDAPTISGTPLTSVDQDVAYNFAPTANDVDVGDVLAFSITNKPDWAVFDVATGILSGTPAHEHVGTTTGIVITVSDGSLTASLPAFNLEVIETIDPLQPVVTAPADITINATGLYTPVSLRQLLSLNPAATQDQVEAILNSMASDGVSGDTCCTTSPEGLNVNNVLLLSPGRHEVVWNATNAADVSGSATQVVAINPLVSLSKSQIAIRGSAVEFRVLLNGKAPEYPFAVPYVLDAATTATSTEHNLVNGVAHFTTTGQMAVSVPVNITNLSGLTDSELVVSLDDSINTGVANTHTISIREGNIAPTVTLRLMQAGVNTTQITPSGGLVTVTATVTDLNPGDTHSYDWSASDTVLGDTDGNPVNNTLVFDPSGLTGRHQAQLTVSDSGGASANVQLYFRMVASLPVLLPDTDTDGDSLNDLDESLGDDNGNGIPNYLDNMPTNNILPQKGAVTNAYLIECDPGVRCGLGKFALVGDSGGVQILEGELGATGELIIDPTFEPVGGIFDFVINDLPTPGQSVRIVIPQIAAIPANAVYRKYQNGVWVNFHEDANNSIFSAPGNPGYCPPPGNPEWTPGLTEGNLCVQLTIEDGGRNDDDGLVNSSVADPGAVSLALPVEPEPPVEPPVEPSKPPVSLKSNGGGAVDGFWILLIGSLLMMKYLGAKHRKGLAIISLLVTSVASQAATDGNAFVRFVVYKVEGISEETFTHSLTTSGHSFAIDNYDVDRRGYQISFGYHWDNNTYTELGYLDLGNVAVDMTLDGATDLAAFQRDFNDAYPVTAKGGVIVQGLTLLKDHPVNLSFEGGAYLWRDDKRTNRNQVTLTNDNGVAPLAGIRLDAGLTQNLSLGFTARRIYLDEQAISLYGLSGSYRF